MTNRFVCVAGLHRTGTSLTARILGSHPSISAITGARVPEDEGCYLQGAIPHTARDGRPGHFATDPAQHHVEGSRYDTLAVRDRLLADWSPWFDTGAPWWLEKSPVNFTRMRLLQQLLPRAHFIVLLRHPQAMAAALAKWTDRPADALIDYAMEAYAQLHRDLAYLHAVCVIRYEDLIARPEAVRTGLFAFLELEDHDPAIKLRDGNADYRLDPSLSDRQAAGLSQWGYGPGGDVDPFEPIVQHPLRSVRETVVKAFEGDRAKKNNKLTCVNGPRPVDQINRPSSWMGS